MKHRNVAFFVPDEGCPHRCSFCNQKTISGSRERLTPEKIRADVEIALRQSNFAKSSQIAFFGGSFTAIDREYMISLLDAAYYYVEKGLFSGIRISTRPDCIDGQILQILRRYGVNAIELGCQSMNDEVLEKNTRGHTAADIQNACRLIKADGFELGVQMMTGLYGDSDEGARQTAERLIALSPDTARIYPTVVLENTRLAELYRSGEYTAQTLDEAVGLCCELVMMFEQAGVRVIRLGLHSGGSVEEGFIAGAYHPAFREKCESEIYYRRFLQLFSENGVGGGSVVVYASPRCISKAVGHGKINLKRLSQAGYSVTVKADAQLEKYQLRM